MDPSEPPPFLLRDVSVIRYDPGSQRPEAKFGDRTVEGIRELKDASRSYSDLPAFDLLRRTHRDPDGNTIRPYYESVLVLCAFSQEYEHQNWDWLEDRLKTAIKAQVADEGLVINRNPTVARTLDMGSTQMVSANLFRAMRMNDLCICDLTEWRPNVLFELGLRRA